MAWPKNHMGWALMASSTPPALRRLVMSESEMGVMAAAIETRPEPAMRLFMVDPFILICEADANEYTFDMAKEGGYERKKNKPVERAAASLYTTSCPSFYRTPLCSIEEAQKLVMKAPVVCRSMSQ